MLADSAMQRLSQAGKTTKNEGIEGRWEKREDEL
jgi:hypothetical protein